MQQFTYETPTDISRIEVIDEHLKRILISINKEVRLSLQDEGRTLKVFLIDKMDDDDKTN